MYATKFKNRFFLIPLIMVAFVAGSCNDDPMGPEEEEHTEAFGFAIEADGAEVLRYMDAQGGNPALALTAGTLYEMVVVFLDENGAPLEHEEHEEGEEEEEEDELRVTIADGSIIAWMGEEHEEGEEEEEHEHIEFHGELNALVAGTTSMQLCLLHEGHCDYDSPSIQVVVN